MNERYLDINQINGLRSGMQVQFAQNQAPDWAYRFASEVLALPDFAVEYYGGIAAFIRVYHTKEALKSMMGIHAYITNRLASVSGNVSWLDPAAAVFTQNRYLSIENGCEVWYPTWEARVHTINGSQMGNHIANAWINGVHDYRTVLAQTAQQIR